MHCGRKFKNLEQKIEFQHQRNNNIRRILIFTSDSSSLCADCFLTTLSFDLCLFHSISEIKLSGLPHAKLIFLDCSKVNIFIFQPWLKKK